MAVGFLIGQSALTVGTGENIHIEEQFKDFGETHEIAFTMIQSVVRNDIFDTLGMLSDNVSNVALSKGDFYDAFARPAHAAFKDIAHPKLAADPAHIDRLCLVGVARVARDDENAVVLREAGNDVLGDFVREVFLVGVVAHVLERQHGDGWLVGQRQCWCGRLGGALPVEFSPIDANRTRDVLQAVLTGIDEIDRHLALHLPPRVFGDRNAARFGDAFDPRRDVDAVAKDILAHDDDIPDVYPDAEAERINFGVRRLGARATVAGFQRRK